MTIKDYDQGRHDERKRTMQVIGAARMDYQMGGSDGSIDVLDRLVMAIASEPLTAIPTTQPPLTSVRVLIALDEDARVRECVVLTDDRQADELFHRLRKTWGGANVAMASRRVDDLPQNLEEKIPDVTEIIQ